MRVVRAFLSVAALMLLLDLSWIGLVAASLYDQALGPLKAPTVNGVAAGIFYVFYVSCTVIHGVLPAQDWKDALRRGAGMGLVAYGTWDLTNWAVLRDFPGWIVPIDLSWGIFLTAACAGVGRAVAGPRS
ncbi:MAG TPA: DUF2177 family protein [Myxococcota bacterium]|nr:DUF2177 family protein [Myxococcota bacterium]